MKKLIFLLIAAVGARSTFAQAPPVRNYATDAELSRVVLDVNFLGGGYLQNTNMTNTAPNYLNGVNINQGTPGFKNGTAFGGDAQVGFFFGQRKHWGIGTGLMFLRENGDLTLNNFHAEYQATDNAGDIYRQVVSGKSVDERLSIDNLSIPIVLKYKKRFSKHWGFAADAGLLVNLQMKNEYKTNAAFDYEAIYKFNNNGDGSQTSVYDNSPTPASTDFMITKAQFIKNNPDGNVGDYFNAKNAQGYNVGLGLSPNNTKGVVSYTTGSVGFLIQPSVNYFFSDHVALNVGAYYLFQPFNNPNTGGYTMTNKPGDYNSVLNSTAHVETQSYGVNLGLRFFFGGRKPVPLNITSVDQMSPSQCQLCDGSFTLHGLPPNHDVTVDYNVNGGSPNRNTSIVQPDGQVNVTHLCAGTYTGIVVTVGNQNTGGKDLTLSDPILAISSQVTSNPTAAGLCNGSVKLSGLNAGQQATINYNLNGSPQIFTAIVNSDNSITISGLCEGKYAGLVAHVGACSANGTDFLLAAPAPPPPPPPPAIVEDEFDLSTPILFDFNKASIHISSYPLLNEASKELIEQHDLYIRVDAHTDAVGSETYNMKLSVRRANSVKTYLRNKGVNPAKVKVYGHGKLEPAASNDSAEGRSKNRRAVMSKTSGK